MNKKNIKVVSTIKFGSKEQSSKGHLQTQLIILGVTHARKVYHSNRK